MKLGLSTYTYSWSIGLSGFIPPKPMSLTDLMDKAVELDVHVLQIVDNLPFDRISPQQWKDFARRAVELGIELELGTSGIGLEHLRKFMQLAKVLNSSFVRTVIDTPDYRPSEEEVVSNVKELLRELEQADLCLAIENHDRFKIKKLDELIERIGSERVAAVLDTTNSFGASEGPELVIDVFGPRTINLHLKDYAIFRDNHLLGYKLEGRPAGQGHLDIPAMLAKLKHQGRNPNVILELLTPQQETLEKTIALEQEWARTSIDYLRQLIPG